MKYLGVFYPVIQLHYCLVRAFEVTPAPVVALFNYLQIVGASLLGYLLVSELPNLWSCIGTFVLSGLVVVFSAVGRRHCGPMEAKRRASWIVTDWVA